LSRENLAAAKQDMIQLLGAGGVNDEIGAQITHSQTEWSDAPHGEADQASFIVYPKSTQDVSNIVKICHKHRIPIIPFSGGTSLESTLAAINKEVFIDFQKMRDIIELHEQDMDVVVQPGISYDALNERLADKRLFFPP
jgi:D-lactate dehydrogenase (cytochrome)